MEKRKNLLFILGIISMIILSETKASMAKGALDLVTLASVLEDENIFINKWSIHAREKVKAISDVEGYAKKLIRDFPEWEWKINQDERHWEAVGILNRETKTEMIKVSTPINNHQNSYIIYEVKGQGWNEEVAKKVSREMENIISSIFREKPTIFSCIQGEISDKMNTTLPNKMEKIIAAFQATEIESLKEDNFMSVSAHSERFNNSIETNRQEMNLQIGLRNQELGDKTTLVVGTPILTIEY